LHWSKPRNSFFISQLFWNPCFFYYLIQTYYLCLWLLFCSHLFRRQWWLNHFIGLVFDSLVVLNAILSITFEFIFIFILTTFLFIILIQITSSFLIITVIIFLWIFFWISRLILKFFSYNHLFYFFNFLSFFNNNKILVFSISFWLFLDLFIGILILCLQILFIWFLCRLFIY